VTTAIVTSSFSALYHPDQIVRYCRTTLSYYINSESTSSIELGTQTHPYKRLNAPFKELFNLFTGTSGYSADVTIYIMAGTKNYIFSEEEHLLLNGIGNVKITPVSFLIFYNIVRVNFEHSR
jgi:hypothetical protein